MSPNTEHGAACPYCDSPLQEVYVITNGGMWFCESREYLEYHVAGGPPDLRDRMAQLSREKPLHCVIGSSGYTKGYGTWPKHGFYCSSCGAITIQTKEPR